jgi:hypothetical protein
MATLEGGWSKPNITKKAYLHNECSIWSSSQLLHKNYWKHISKVFPNYILDNQLKAIGYL